MAGKRLLIADADARTWDNIRLALGDEWVVVGAASCAAALDEAQKLPFNVVVANYDLPELGGAELLNRLRLANPETLRFIAAPVTLKEKVMASVLGGDQFLAAPFDSATLKASIERSLVADYGMSNSVRELVARIRSFPTIPSLYLEVVNALQDPNAGTADIGAIITKDMSMTTKLVQVINSAYFGVPRTITNPTEAIGLMGFETVKHLIITVKMLSQYDKVKPVYFSIDNVWRHSTNVARTAKVMAQLETNDANCSATAYAAGLMHDVGKVILAANFDAQYHTAHALARKEHIPLWEVEKSVFGATHGEIGAYLLALWGMSDEVVKVAAMHHEPLHSDDKNFTALTAVHVANVLEYEGNAEADGLAAPMFDLAYLQKLGMEDRVELWRLARRNPQTGKPNAKMLHAKSAPPPADNPVLSLPAVTPHTASSVPAPLRREPFSFSPLWKWLGLGFGVVATLALTAQFEMKQLESRMQTVPTVNQTTGTIEAPTKAVIEIRPAPAPPVKVASVSATPPPRAPEQTDFDRLKLQAIFFSAEHPSALINGKLVVVNQNVADCRVLDITPTSITLEHQHQRKTLTMR